MNINVFSQDNLRLEELWENSVQEIENMKLNDDGSVDIYFSKTAPEGLESNWIPTNGEDFFLLFRLYGPEDAYYDKSFQLPDVQLVK